MCIISVRGWTRAEYMHIFLIYSRILALHFVGQLLLEDASGALPYATQYKVVCMRNILLTYSHLSAIVMPGR